MSQIQTSYFSRHLYVVNLILLSVLHFWTNFDEKISFHILWPILLGNDVFHLSRGH